MFLKLNHSKKYRLFEGQLYKPEQKKLGIRNVSYVSSKEFYFRVEGFTALAFVLLLLKKLRMLSKLYFIVFATV